MGTIDNAIKKLRLLGHELLLLSEDAFIGVNKATGRATCYTVDSKNKLLFKSYDSVYFHEEYFVGTEDDKTEILDKSLKIIAKFKGETIDSLVGGIIVLYRPSDQTYRISSIHGKPLSSPLIQHIQLWKDFDGDIITRQYINRELYKISMIHEEKVHNIIEVLNVVDFAVGKRSNKENVVIIQTNEGVRVYTKDLNKILLVAKNGHIQKSTDTANIVDKYNNIILTIQLGTKIYG